MGSSVLMSVSLSEDRMSPLPYSERGGQMYVQIDLSLTILAVLVQVVEASESSGQ